MAYLYQPKLRKKGCGICQRTCTRHGKRSQVWWVKYYANGVRQRKSTGTRKESEAKRVARELEGRIARGEPILPRADRISYEEAAKDLREYYQTSGSRDLEADHRLKPLDRLFRGRRLASVGPADATKYALSRQGEGKSNGTINRELAVLGRMLKLAYENGKLLRLPVIRKLKESGPRQGFFEREQFDAVRRRLPLDLQAAVTIAHTFGWRMQSEILSLKRHQLDLEAAPDGTLRLEPGTTKNREGRIVYLTPELRTLLAAARWSECGRWSDGPGRLSRISSRT